MEKYFNVIKREAATAGALQEKVLLEIKMAKMCIFSPFFNSLSCTFNNESEHQRIHKVAALSENLLLTVNYLVAKTGIK